MYNAAFAGNFDLTSLIFDAFVLFFVGLIIYLRREDRREGYPLEDDVTGKQEALSGLLFMAEPKTFILPHGAGLLTKPNSQRESQAVNASRTGRAPGSPLAPNGNPMLAGVGPGAFAERSHIPDLTFDGHPKIVPLSKVPQITVAVPAADPRGMTVIGVDGAAAGVVSDIWMDLSEYIVRYLEVTVSATSHPVLLPLTMAVIDKGAKTVKVDAITGAQFAHVPVLATPGQVTLYEEERIVAYYGAGYLYATPARSEPWL
jgi:photosynthetic reaction center H subunit